MIDWKTLHGDHFRDVAVLVTGGAGFIGLHLAEALLHLGAQVTVLDNLCGGEHRLNLEGLEDGVGPRLRFVESSILDVEVVKRCTRGCRYVFHEAALGSVPRSIERPRQYTEVNITGTLNVLEAVRATGVQRVVYAASSSAYGDSPQLPKIEAMRPMPKSPYAASKLAGEYLVAAYSSSYGLDTASLRYFNVFGPRQNANTAYAAVVAAFATALLSGKRPTIYGDGEQSRDFTEVTNAVQANLLAARCERPIEGRVINVACGRQVTINVLAQKMIDLVGKPHLTPRHEPERPGEVRHSLAELGQAKAVLGYQPIVDLDAGLAATVAWFRDQVNGII